jgi:carboxypeptidase family protein
MSARRVSVITYAALDAVVLALILTGEAAVAQPTGSIQGNVTDSSGSSILGAVVTVEGADGNSHTTVTDREGAFQISSLPPGNYHVKVSASGLADWTASNVPASTAPESKPLQIVMEVAAAVTSVTVGLAPEELAEEQLKQETQQRVLGVLPNYYVAYESHPAPLSPKQKFHLSLKTLVDPATIAAVGITAGIQQGENSYYQFGQGSEGYAKRFGAAYGNAATNLLITSVAADSVLHQDPRYFFSGKGSIQRRAWYAVESAFRAKGDNGKWQPPYAGLLGAVAGAEVSNLYYPGYRSQHSLIGRAILFHFAGLIGLNLTEELFLKKLTTHAQAQSAATAPVLREGTPVPLIAVEGFGPQEAGGGQTATFVLAEDLIENGKVLARTGDVASGLVTQVVAGSVPHTGSVALQNVTLRAGGAINVPLRPNQVRGDAVRVPYKELNGSEKVEFTLFVATNMEFPNSE